jgi:hypothetical protein
VRVGAGDVDGDGLDDIITGAEAPVGGHVKAFSGATGAELASFIAYPGFAGACLSRLETSMVIAKTTSSPVLASGAAGGHVKVFSGANGSLLRSFLAYPGFVGGVTWAR